MCVTYLCLETHIQEYLCAHVCIAYWMDLSATPLILSASSLCLLLWMLLHKFALCDNIEV